MLLIQPLAMSAPTLPFQLDAFSPDRFQILDLLGEGGMGQVFRARDRHLNRMVALKFLSGIETPERLSRLVHEAQCLALVDHPHLLKVYELGRWEGRACAVMQLVEGDSLDRMARDLLLPERVQMVAQAARGVHAAHLQGLLHRDLKPHNIMVGRDAEGRPQACVTDFGLAKAVAFESLTLSGNVLGSPHFMSPEQAQGLPVLDATSDVYSLGATLYALVTGVPPHASSRDDAALPMRGDEASREEAPQVLNLLHRVMEEDPVPPRTRNPEVPQPLEVIIQRAMEREAHRRYPTAEALAEDLERFLEGRPIEAQALSLLRRVQKWGRRHPALGLSVALALGIAILLWGGWAVSARRERQRAEVAARFERALRDLEYRRHLNALAPPHDRSPEHEELRVQLDALQTEARQLGRLGEGPGAFAKGCGLRLLGQPREALFYLRQAWDGGLRTPAAARALGLALIEIYQQETAALDVQREGVAQGLAKEYLEPSLAFMRMADAGTHEQLFHAAQIAFLEGRDDEALDLARRAVEASPWLYDAHVLRHRVWARRTELALDLDTFRHCSREAAACLEAAQDLARSDSSLRLALAEWRVAFTLQLARRFGSLSDEGLQEAIDGCDAVLRYEPRTARAWAVRSTAWMKRGLNRRYGTSGRYSAESCFDQALVDADKALALAPQDPKALVAKAWALVMKADETPAKPEARERLNQALVLSKQALASDPRLPAAYRLLSVVHQFLSVGDLVLDVDPVPNVLASGEACLEAYRIWPWAGELAGQAATYLLPLVYIYFERGDAPKAQQEITRLVAMLETAWARQPENPRILRSLGEMLCVQHALDGLRGADPHPALARAETVLDRCLPANRRHQEYLDLRFKVDHLRAVDLMESGGDALPMLERLRATVDQGIQERASADWLWQSQLAWLSLRAQIPEAARRYPATYLPRREGRAVGSKYAAAISTAQGALRAHEGSGAAALAQAKADMTPGFQEDFLLRWLYRREWRKVTGGR